MAMAEDVSVVYCRDSKTQPNLRATHGYRLSSGCSEYTIFLIYVAVLGWRQVRSCNLYVRFLVLTAKSVVRQNGSGNLHATLVGYRIVINLGVWYAYLD